MRTTPEPDSFRFHPSIPPFLFLMFVLYLDPYPLGDPLFATGLARDLKARMDAGGGGFVIVHGAGEEGERAIEALGLEPRREDGALVLPDAESARAVERAVRDLNRRLVDALNEDGISAVRVLGTDRGLVRADGTFGKTRWLADLARQRAVPVVASWGPRDSGEGAERDPAGFARGLADELGGVPLVALGTPPAGLERAVLDEASGWVPDAKALGRMASGGREVRVVRRAALRQPGVPTGVDVSGEDKDRL